MESIMIEMKGITDEELVEKYKEPKERRDQSTLGFKVAFQVTDNIRIQSKNYFYKWKRLREKRDNKYPHEELYWCIIPNTRSKQLEREIYEIRDGFYKNKTASDLAVIATMK